MTYFLYYNENNAGIETIDYNTNFDSQLIAGTLTVSVGSEYTAVLEEGLAVTELTKSGINFHTDESLSPEKELSHPDLRFLAHCDENQGTTVSDSTGNVADGTFRGEACSNNLEEGIYWVVPDSLGPGEVTLYFMFKTGIWNSGYGEYYYEVAFDNFTLFKRGGGSAVNPEPEILIELFSLLIDSICSRILI